jgi:hypothetical protein
MLYLLNNGQKAAPQAPDFARCALRPGGSIIRTQI